MRNGRRHPEEAAFEERLAAVEEALDEVAGAQAEFDARLQHAEEQLQDVMDALHGLGDVLRRMTGGR